MLMQKSLGKACTEEIIATINKSDHNRRSDNKQKEIHGKYSAYHQE